VSDTRRVPAGHAVYDPVVTEPGREDDAPLEREAREAARGDSEKTPLLLFGAVGVTIAVFVGGLVLVALLIWLVA
jgi:hypothetical protein